MTVPALTVPPLRAQMPGLSMTIEREDLIRYAGGADDYVRQHWDHPFMIENGFPDVVVHGWLTFAHMCRVVEAWLPPSDWTISRYSVRYVKTTFPGHVSFGGEVIESSRQGADLSLWARNEVGEVTTTAIVTVTPKTH